MTKHDYLKKLSHALRRVKAKERKKFLAYFSEVIDDRVEEGVSEADAVAGLESVEAAAERILDEAAASGQLKPHRSVRVFVLLVLGFPLWFPLLLTAALVILIMYGVVWIFIGTFFILAAALAGSGAAGVFGLGQALFLGRDLASAFAMLAVGLVCAGLGLAVFVPTLYAARAYAKATPSLWRKLIGRKAELS
jgi:uncharacterized membrane protein